MAVFSVLHAVVLRPLPYDDPERLVRVYHVASDTDNYMPLPAFLAFQRRQHDARSRAGLHLQQRGRRPDRSCAAGACHRAASRRRLFPRRLACGRWPWSAVHSRRRARDCGRGRHQRAHLARVSRRAPGCDRSDAVRQRRAPAAWSRCCQTPSRIRWWPASRSGRRSTSRAANRTQWYNHYLSVVGRLRPGATLEQAQAELKTIARADRVELRPEQRSALGASDAAAGRHRRYRRAACYGCSSAQSDSS